MANNENESSSTKELIAFLSASNEALRLENLRLLDEVERLTNNIEVHDAEIITAPQIYYSFKH
jgi:hypothetical protein